MIDWNTLINACVTGSTVGVVTGLTNWLLNRHLLRNLERLEESIGGKKKENNNATNH